MLEAKKSLGQNFLIDKNKINKIIESLKIDGNSHVIEVGPGKGALTNEIVKITEWLSLIEIDGRMVEILNQNQNLQNKIINQDILKTNLSNIFKNKNKHFVSNLPYYIASKIIFKVLEEKEITKISIMLQKEMGQRILAKNNTKDFGRLTVAIRTFFEVESKIEIPASCFDPKPKVDSVFINLTRKNVEEIKHEDLGEYLDFIKKCFGNKRKTLLNSLKINNFNNIDKIKIFFEKNHIPTNIRGEQLEVEIYIKMWNFMRDNM